MVESPITFLDDNMTRCPYCGKVNPEIRRTPAFGKDDTVTVIYSCAACKKIINLEHIEMPIKTAAPEKK
jgi:DNA-directed RNA polymerase subunit RPC12/RpoP